MKNIYQCSWILIASVVYLLLVSLSPFNKIDLAWVGTGLTIAIFVINAIRQKQKNTGTKSFFFICRGLNMMQLLAFIWALILMAHKEPLIYVLAIFSSILLLFMAFKHILAGMEDRSRNSTVLSFSLMFIQAVLLASLHLMTFWA